MHSSIKLDGKQWSETCSGYGRGGSISGDEGSKGSSRERKKGRSAAGQVLVITATALPADKVHSRGRRVGSRQCSRRDRDTSESRNNSRNGKSLWHGSAGASPSGESVGRD